MLTVSDVSLRFSDRKLFDDVNIAFTPGNTYGLIGANGAGKSTFLKILAGDIEPTTGHISLGPDERLSVLRQNHFDYEDERVIDVVIMGNERLYDIMKEKDAIYMKEDFSDEDGVRDFKESVIFASHDHEFIQTIANHIVVVSKNGVIDRIDETYDEFLENEEVQAKVKALWAD